MANYQIQAGTQLDDFESLTNWSTNGTGGTMAIDNSIYQTGSGSLKVTSQASSFYAGVKSVSLDLSRAGVISFDVYIEDITNVSNVTLYISSTTNWSKYFSFSFSALNNGWQRVRLPRSGWSNSNGEDWTNTMLRYQLRVTANANGSGVAYFDNLTYGTYHRPKIVWTADDNYSSQYSQLYPYFQKYKLKGTLFIVGSFIGGGSAMSASQMTELYNAGWDVLNHTQTHPNLTSEVDDIYDAQSEVLQDKSLLEGYGYIRNNALMHFAYPKGGYNDSVISMLNANGFLTARTNHANAKINVATPFLNPLALTSYSLTTSVTLQNAKDQVDYAIASGTSMMITSHEFIASPSTTNQWAITDMQALVDYMVSKSDQIDIVPLTEWYRGITNSRKLA